MYISFSTNIAMYNIKGFFCYLSWRNKFSSMYFTICVWFTTWLRITVIIINSNSFLDRNSKFCLIKLPKRLCQSSFYSFHKYLLYDVNCRTLYIVQITQSPTHINHIKVFQNRNFLSTNLNETPFLVALDMYTQQIIK